MPRGFIITKWTEDKGLVVQISYPENIEVDLDDMMRIFYAHITGAGEAGNVLVTLEKAHSNVYSYFTGKESEIPFMINLMLELGEGPDMFGEAVIQEINVTILSYLNQMGTNISQTYEIVKNLKEYLKNALFLLDRLKNLTKEQRLAQIYGSEKGRKILKLLQERARSSKEIHAILEEELGKIVFNLEFVLDPFIKTDLVKQDWIEGVPDIILYLLSDFTLFRTPATKLIEEAKKKHPTPDLAKKYLRQARKFFSTYKPSFQDNLIIAQNMVNPEKHDFISLFRERSYPLNNIPKGSGSGFIEISELIRLMERDQIIKIIKDKKNVEWIFLLTDVSVQTFYPEYLIEKIRKDRTEGKLKKEIAIKHLKLLEKEYTKEDYL